MSDSRRLVITRVLEWELARHAHFDAAAIAVLAEAIEEAIARETADIAPEEGRRPEELTASNDG